jgi:predicted RNA binding protein YcfA (HicA-like mRNA interferase family)
MPRITGADAVRAFERAGFLHHRTTGSHKILKREDGLRLSIPVHAGRIIGVGLLKSLLNDAEMSVEDLAVNQGG